MSKNLSDTGRRQNSGFTLVEILIAIVVVGILATVAIVGIGGLTKSGNKSACTTSADAAKAAAAAYYADKSVWPTNLAQVVANGQYEVPTGVTASSGALSASKGTDWTFTLTGVGSGPIGVSGCACPPFNDVSVIPVFGRPQHRQGFEGNGLRVRDSGESLIEVLATIVIVSIAVVALVASLASASRSSVSHRRAQKTDAVMRNFAERLKLATSSCVAGVPYTVSYNPPEGYVVGGSSNDDSTFTGTSGTCPTVDRTQVVTLSAAYTGVIANTIQLVVRTP